MDQLVDQYEKYREEYLAALEEYNSTNDNEYLNRLMSKKAEFEKMPNFLELVVQHYVNAFQNISNLENLNFFSTRQFVRYLVTTFFSKIMFNDLFFLGLFCNNQDNYLSVLEGVRNQIGEIYHIQFCSKADIDEKISGDTLDGMGFRARVYLINGIPDDSIISEDDVYSDHGWDETVKRLQTLGLDSLVPQKRNSEVHSTGLKR